MTRFLRLLLAAALVAAAGPGWSQLIGLTHESGASQVAEIDSASVVTPIGAPDLPTGLGYASASFDPFAGAIFALGPDAVAADGTTALFRFDTATGARTQVGNTGSDEQVAALRFELATQRLIAALVDPGTGTLRLAAVDGATGALSPVHTGIADCCVLEPGVATERTGEVLLVGRLTTSPDTERYLISLSTTGDNASSFTLLDGPLSVIAWDRVAMRLYGVQQTTTAPPVGATLQPVEVQAAGTFVSIGVPTADCCGLLPGIGTLALSAPNQLFVAGGTLGQPNGIIPIDLTTGTISAATSLPATTVINALFDIDAGLSPTTTTIDSVVPSPVTIGQSYTVTATVASMATIDGGTITVDDGLGNSCNFPVTAGSPTGACALTATQVGPLTITATYSGTLTLAPSLDTAAQTVVQAVSTTGITAIAPSPVDVGQNYTVSVSVTGFNPTGTVDIDDGQGQMCQVVLPATGCMLNAPTVGPRTITANYSGDVNNLPSSAVGAQTVVQVVSTTNIDSIVPEPSTVGNAYTVNVSVVGFGPTGSVLVDDGAGNNCTIALPATSCLLANAAAGTLTVSAAYSGDVNNTPSGDSTPHGVDPETSTTTIDSIVPEPSIAGDDYTVNVTVTGFNPTGTVAVDDGTGKGCSIVLPATSCLLTNGGAGTLTVTAAYPGDGNNTPSSDTAPHVVDPTSTTTSIDLLDPSPAGIGQPYAVEVSVVGFEPTGTIAVSDDAGASCTITLPDTACDLVSTVTGTRTITADYSGDANNLPSSDSASQTITLAVTTLTLSTPSTVVPQGVDVQLLATVNGGFAPVGGTVQFARDGQPIVGCDPVPVVAEQAACLISFPNQGVFTISADYSGDVNNLPSSASLRMQVNPLVVPTLSPAALLLMVLLLGLLGAVATARRPQRQ